jgi:hypothetical protein
MDPLGLRSDDGVRNSNRYRHRDTDHDRDREREGDHRHVSHPGFHDVDSLPDPNLPTSEHRSHTQPLSHALFHARAHGHGHGAAVGVQEGGGADVAPVRRSSPDPLPISGADSNPSPGTSPSPVATAIPLIDRPRPQVHTATAYVPSLPLTNMSSATGETDRPRRRRDDSGDSSEQLLGTGPVRSGTAGTSRTQGRQNVVDEQAIFELAHAGKKNKSNGKQHMVSAPFWLRVNVRKCR